MHIGIDEQRHKVYEGQTQYGVTPIQPTPFIFNIRFGATAAEAIDNLTKHSPHDYKFREDLYDPISRTKRGRVYHRNGCNLTWHRFAESEYEKQKNRSEYIAEDLPTYGRIWIDENFLFAAIGTERSSSIWRIVAKEQMVNNEEILTFQPVLFMGILPELETSLIPLEIRSPLMNVLKSVSSDMKRSVPGSVIDRCRGAAALALQSMEGCKGKDLGKQANYIETEHKRFVIASCAKIINSLHTRAKENTQHDNQYRPPNERDAELAVHCLACILTELGFTK